MSEEANIWRKCSSCKKPIMLGQKYYVCSVSTCNGQRTGYVFCRIECWDAHVPGAGHRSSGAIEKQAPKSAQNIPSVTEPARRIVTTSQKPHGFVAPQAPKEILIVASKLKDYIRIKSDMNTSASVMDVLSEKVRALCDEAIEQARADGRKTVMDKDF